MPDVGGIIPIVIFLKIYDAHIITAEYLIDNIDCAFDNWQKRPWNRSLSFEDFCEYLLPYRIGMNRWKNGVNFMKRNMDIY